MYVIRPRRIHKTPFQLANDLHCQTRRWPNRQAIRPDYLRDFIMTPVPPQNMVNATPEYVAAFHFLTRNKYGQRKRMEEHGIPIPRTFITPQSAGSVSWGDGARFVVRPHNHSRGTGYRVTTNPLDFNPEKEYIAELYPKKREYRVVFVFGKPLIVLRKKPKEGVTDAEPWGHANAFFQTINDVPHCRLMGTDFFPRMASFEVIAGCHLVAADVLYNAQHSQPYVVLELNNCPALDIDNNRQRVVEAIRARV